MQIEQAINKQTPILAEGSMYDRLMRLAGELFDPELGHLGLIQSEQGKETLKSTYSSYIDVASTANLPIVIFTPTWKANPDRINRSSMKSQTINQDAAKFVLNFRDKLNAESRVQIFVGGLMGCRGDCYDPSVALSEKDAEKFHSTQSNALAESGVDFLFASTLPAVSEAKGIGLAMAATNRPYILSFVVDQHGNVLDGTPLPEAIRLVDESVARIPLGYFVNCVHPSILYSGLDLITNGLNIVQERLIGFQGNTSTRDPREFDSLEELETEDPESFARASLHLQRRYGLKILGGCCGTGPEHIEAIAKLLNSW